MASEIATAAANLQDALEKHSVMERDALMLSDESDSKALFNLLSFLAKRMSIYTTSHTIVVTKAGHVV